MTAGCGAVTLVEKKQQQHTHKLSLFKCLLTTDDMDAQNETLYWFF